MSIEIIKETMIDDSFRYGYYAEYGIFIYHREEKDGPAVIYSDGSKEWHKNNMLHREDGPAIICEDGSQFWLLNDDLHREDGPAEIWKDGKHTWAIEGEDVSKEVEEWLKERNIENYKDMTDEDQLALTFFMRSLI